MNMPTEVTAVLPISAEIVDSHRSTQMVRRTRLTTSVEEYEIEVKGDEVKWTVYRQYNDFQ